MPRKDWRRKRWADLQDSTVKEEDIRASYLRQRSQRKSPPWEEGRGVPRDMVSPRSRPYCRSMTERETWIGRENGSAHDEKDKDPFRRHICMGRRLRSHSHRNGIVKAIDHDGGDRTHHLVSSA